MQRSKLQRDDGKHQPNDGTSEISILEIFDHFVFSILPCEVDLARKIIRERFDSWGTPIVLDEPRSRDVRKIYLSKDGPKHPPAIKKAMLLTEISGCEGKKTLFVSSVADGNWTLVVDISKAFPVRIW